MNWLRRSVMLLSLATAFVMVPLFAQDKKSDKSDKKPVDAKTNEKAKEKAAGRLPNYMGQLELSDDQKEKIYAIQKKYKEKKEPLENEIEKLRDEVKAKQKSLDKIDTQEDTEVEAILTAEQKKEYEKAKSEAKKSRDERKNKRAKKAGRKSES